MTQIQVSILENQNEDGLDCIHSPFWTNYTPFCRNEDGLDALVYHKSSTIVLSWYYAYDERTQLTCEASYSETRVRNEGKSILNLPAYEVSP